MKVNIEAALKHLFANAQLAPTGYCARAIRLALEAGGMNTDGHPGSAKDYGPFLLKHGYTAVTDTPRAGDIVVLPALPNLEFGHIAMYDVAHWISDFRQNDMWGGPAWRADKHFVLYRQVE